ncbi:Crp/Fnr family transcriptional regulator [Palleronia sp. LCG004]|uniref:Crp/Fnr family transcriptional regulator n=1 Tax=Palleronia sp. LCG004 TaxID=3079304 RepID=UPI002942F0D5|nr:Crp/Fnr family transcriptional regulator [Palleronia sp. LCG004]WOI56017.1 Crp/Fnr family transcriptional regulator [Palleronia sp. LCG004]
MATDCRDCPLRAMPCFENLREDELAFISQFKAGELDVAAGTPIMIEQSKSPQLFTVLRGMGLRYKTLSDGRRQVTNFIMPGDLVGVQGALLDGLSYSVEATTEMTLCVFRRSELWKLFRAHPERGFDLTWLVCKEEHFLGEALTTVGQRSALERISWALVHIHDRARELRLVENGILTFPFRQQDLADALGLSLVHTNKTLAKLRERNLATWSEGLLRINDRETLREIAMMDDSASSKPRPLL